MWPFKKKVTKPRDPAPCGYDETHYEWEDDGWSCPLCAAQEEKRKAEAELKRKAKVSAAAIREELLPEFEKLAEAMEETMKKVIAANTPATARAINRELKSRGIAAEVHQNRDYVYFSGPATERWVDSAVYVSRIADLTLEDWMREFDALNSQQR